MSSIGTGPTFELERPCSEGADHVVSVAPLADIGPSLPGRHTGWRVVHVRAMFRRRSESVRSGALLVQPLAAHKCTAHSSSSGSRGAGLGRRRERRTQLLAAMTNGPRQQLIFEPGSFALVLPRLLYIRSLRFRVRIYMREYNSPAACCRHTHTHTLLDQIHTHYITWTMERVLLRLRLRLRIRSLLAGCACACAQRNPSPTACDDDCI